MRKGELIGPASRGPSIGGSTRKRNATDGPREAMARAVPLLLLAGAVAAFLWENRQLSPQIDDAYISYRYARNLVEGHGLVYNPGEYVEGYTNLLWTLLIALGLSLGLQAELVAHWLGLASGTAVLALTYLYAGIDLPPRGRWLAGAAPWLVLLSVAFPLWSTSGLETPLFTAAVTAALIAYMRGNTGWALAALATATLTRPEGALVALAVLAFYLVKHGKGPRRALFFPLAYCAFLLALTGWRLAYYGSPLPNTFHAKVGGIPIVNGLLYAADFLVDGAVYLILPALASLLLRSVHRPGGAVALVFLFYAVLVGRDSFWDSRFLLVTLPVLAAVGVHGCACAWKHERALGAVMGLSLAAFGPWSFFGEAAGPAIALTLTAAALLPALRMGRPRRAGPVAVAVAAILAVLAIGMALRDFPLPNTADLLLYGKPLPVGPAPRSRRIADIRRLNLAVGQLAERLSTNLREQHRPGQLVAAVGIGRLGYISRLPILDLVGIVDPVVAVTPAAPEREGDLMLAGHQRSNAPYVLSRRPGFVLIAGADTNNLPAARDLLQSPAFHQQYLFDPLIPGYRMRQSPPDPGTEQVPTPK